MSGKVIMALMKLNSIANYKYSRAIWGKNNKIFKLNSNSTECSALHFCRNLKLKAENWKDCLSMCLCDAHGIIILHLAFLLIKKI